MSKFSKISLILALIFMMSFSFVLLVFKVEPPDTYVYHAPITEQEKKATIHFLVQMALNPQDHIKHLQLIKKSGMDKERFKYVHREVTYSIMRGDEEIDESQMPKSMILTADE